MTEAADLKVLYIFGSFGGGGTEHHFVELMRQRDGSSLYPHVFIISLNDDTADALINDGIPVSFVPKKPPFFPGAHLLKSLVLLTRILRTEKFDVIQTYFFNGQFYGASLARLFGHKSIVSNREDMGFAHNKLELMLLRLTNRFVNRIVCIAQTVASACERSERISAAKIEVIHNGVPELPDHSIQGNTRTDDCLPMTVICVANMNFRIKGHEYLLRGIKSIRDRGYAVTLSLIGDGLLKPELRMLTESLGIGDAVSFLGYCDDVHSRLIDADFFVSPSLTEGLSIAILEAARAGLPIVATDVGGNSEIVQHEHNGLLIPSKDSDAIADGIVRLILDAKLRDRMARNARDTVRKQFSIQRTLDSYIKLYRSLVSEAATETIDG